MNKSRSPASPLPHAARYARTAGTHRAERRLSFGMFDTSVSITRGVTTFQRLCRRICPAIPYC
jgi:hypothetical protein